MGLEGFLVTGGLGFLVYVFWHMITKSIPRPKIAKFLQQLQAQAEPLKVSYVNPLKQRNCDGDAHIILQSGELQIAYWRCVQADHVEEKIGWSTNDDHEWIQITFYDSQIIKWSGMSYGGKSAGKQTQAACTILEIVQGAIANSKKK